MRFMIFVAAVVICGCISGCSPEQHVEGDFVPYIVEFERVTGVRVTVSVTYQDLIGLSEAGQCVMRVGGSREVLIDRELWLKECPGRRRAILFHELGHCVLNRGHAPIGAFSYMVPQISESCEFYDKNKEALDRELVGHPRLPKITRL